MTVPPCLCFSSVSIQENAGDCNMGFLTKTGAQPEADCTFRLWRTKMQTQDWAFCAPNGAEHFNPAFECAGGAVGFAKPHPPFRRSILFCLARNCNVQPLFLCAAKKKPLAVKRKRQRGICVGTNSTSLILSAACGGQASSVPLFLLFPHESLRWIRVGALPPLQFP